MSQNYSVLMSVYHKEKPEYLRESMESIYNQTIPTDNFVLVCDGPLNPPLDEVIAQMQEKFGHRLYVHRLAKNGGLGNALNEGMTYCRHELVARMDSDDVSHNDRCEREIYIFENHPDVSIVSGVIEEFVGDISHIQSRRVVPQRQKDIIAFAKKRNPFNHPCVMYRKSAVEAAGGYQDFYLLEDYYLWIRMLQKGFIGYNIQTPILWMRAGSDMYKRRGGWKYVQSQIQLFKYMKDTGFISFGDYIMQAGIRMCAAMVPNALRKIIFQNALRNRVNNAGGVIPELSLYQFCQVNVWSAAYGI